VRCKACDKILTDFEATRKSRESGHYVDLCNRCFLPIKGIFKVDEREDLRTHEVPRNDHFWQEDDEDED
jgi:hypothetical protein